jgi:hypothetical protein
MKAKSLKLSFILGAFSLALLVGTLLGLALPIPDGQNTLTRNQCLKENCDPKPSSKVVEEKHIAGNDIKTLDGCKRVT